MWNFAPNLVHVKPYRFFQGTADINAPPSLTKKEHDNEPLTHKEVDSNKVKISQENSVESGVAAETSSTDEKIVEGASTRLSGDFRTHIVINDSPEDIQEQLSRKDSRSVSDSAEPSSICNEAGCDDQNEDLVDLDKTGKNCAVVKTDEINLTNVDQVSSEHSKDSMKAVDLQQSDGKRKNSELCIIDKDLLKDSGEEVAGMKENIVETQKEIDWDDTDDYLLHLEEILTRIHTAFYDMYEQSQKNGSTELPDLKSIVPYVRKKVLKGAHIVFSGMVPLNMPIEKSRAYIVASALGATIQTDIVVSKTKSGKDPSATTHLVAAKAGTGKYKSALKVKGLHIVSGEWLWACSERWEWVEEGLFPLNSQSVSAKTEGIADERDSLAKKRGSKRKQDKIEQAVPDDKCLEDEDANEEVAAKKQRVKALSMESGSGLVGNASTESEINPIYSFSDEDLVSMDKEVDLFLEGEDDDSSDETDDERDKRIRKNVLGSGDDSDSDSDTLSGDFPRGWKLRRKSFNSSEAKDSLKMKEDRSDAEEDEDTENELEQYQKNISAFSPDESCSSNSADSIGSVDDEIAEAVEKEFLASL